MLIGLLFATTLTLLAPSAAGRNSSSESPSHVLDQGKALCAQGQYDKGIDRIFRAAVLGQKDSAGRRHRMAWRAAARRCFVSWIKALSKCRPEPDVAKKLADLDAVAARAVKVAMPTVVRKARMARKRCLARLPQLLKKQCHDEPGIRTTRLVTLVTKALAPAAEVPHSALTEARAACVERWRTNLELRCRVHPDMATAREAAALVPAAFAIVKKRAKATYEACIRAMADRGLAMCRSGRYLQGRKLVEESLGRFGFYGAKDPRFIEKVTRTMKAECGRFLVRLTGTVVAKVGRIRMKLALSGGLVLTGTRRLAGTFLLESKPLWANAGKATVQVRTQTCRAKIAGRYNPKTHNLAWWPREKMTCSESIQVTSPNGRARVIRETVLADMVKAARLVKTWMPGTQGSRLGLNLSGSIGGGRTVRLNGAYDLKVIDR